MGAVLYQQTPQGQRRIISCASAKFSKTEAKYHCNEQEVLAVVWGCKKYRALLEDKPFTLRTDSRALQWLNKYRDSRAKLTRWSLLLQEYTFQVEHCPGRENQLPDLLSRHPEDSPENHEPDTDRLLPPETANLVSSKYKHKKVYVNASRVAEEWSTKIIPQNRTPVDTDRRRKMPLRVPRSFIKPIRLQQVTLQQRMLPLFEQIAHAQRDSPEYQATRARWHRLRNGQEEATQSWQRHLRDDYTVDDDLIWYTRDNQKALVVPLNFWLRVLQEFHDSPTAGHPGRDETLMATSRLYYWPAMRKQAQAYVRNCLICASTKRGGALQPAAPLRPHPPVRPWQTISLDIMGPYPRTSKRNRFLIVATDLFSRWVEAKAVPRARTQEVLQFLEELCQRWGYPENTITDNGMPFTSRAWECFHETNNIAIYTSPIYHHRSNPVERRNQELKKLLRVHLRNKQENQWDQEIGNILFILRNRTNAATGVTPSEALLGAQLVRPGEWRHPQVRQSVWNQQTDREERIQKMRTRQIGYTRRIFPEPRVAPKHFNIGDQVLVRTFAGTQTAFSAPWSGPYSVVSVKGENVYEVDRNGTQSLVHVDDLRPLPSMPVDLTPEEDPFTQTPNERIPESSTLEEDLMQHLEEEKEPELELREPQPGPSSRAPDPAEFARLPPKTNTMQVQPVTIQDLVNDPGDPDEARPEPGLVPIVGLYP